MKKLIFALCLLPLVLNGQIDTNHYLKGVTLDSFIPSQKTVLIYDTTIWVDKNGEYWTLKKKKKSSDSGVNVQLSENYPPNGMVFKPAKKWNYKRSLIGCGVAFIGGMANGYNQTILHHYPQFKRVHPNANDQFWNPEISWLNKYEDFDKYGKKEAYFGSTTFLAWTTDAYHLSSVISNTSIVGATCIMTIGERRKWWQYGIDIVAMSLARSAGFHLIYSKIYK